MSPAIVGEFFTTSAMWEALCPLSIKWDLRPHLPICFAAPRSQVPGPAPSASEVFCTRWEVDGIGLTAAAIIEKWEGMTPFRSATLVTLLAPHSSPWGGCILSSQFMDEKASEGTSHGQGHKAVSSRASWVQRAPKAHAPPTSTWLQETGYTLAEGLKHPSSAVSGPVSSCFRVSHISVTPRSKWIACTLQDSSW